jgi:IS5 family transposase
MERRPSETETTDDGADDGFPPEKRLEAPNTRLIIDEQRYNQRSMTETANSAVKRSLGFALRARSWFREFREIALTCVVSNTKRAVKQ